MRLRQRAASGPAGRVMSYGYTDIFHLGSQHQDPFLLLMGLLFILKKKKIGGWCGV
jgi:hypothetical protein